MNFFDTHTHLDYLQLDTGEPLEQLLAQAQNANVQRILIVAVCAADFDRIAAMCARYPQQLCYGLGLHPLHILRHTFADLDALEQRLQGRDKNCVAVAEIGLERAVPALLEPLLWQKQWDFLTAQLALAKRYQLPVNLHSRKAHDQLYVALKQAQLPRTGVVHGFAGSYEQAKRFVDLGYKIGVGGTITYARANKTRQAIARLPLDSLVLETDSPDMPVFGFQGQPNRPERLVQIFQSLCQLRPESPEEIATTIWQTSFWEDKTF